MFNKQLIFCSILAILMSNQIWNMSEYICYSSLPNHPKTLKGLILDKIVNVILSKKLESENELKLLKELTEDLRCDLYQAMLKNYYSTFWTYLLPLGQIIQIKKKSGISLTKYINHLKENYFEIECFACNFLRKVEKIIFTKNDKMFLKINTTKLPDMFDRMNVLELFFSDVYNIWIQTYVLMHKSYTSILFFNYIGENDKIYSIAQLLEKLSLESIFLIKILENQFNEKKCVKLESIFWLGIFNNMPENVRHILSKKFNIVTC